jgi:hypothetical protein
MSARPITLALLTLAASALTACADATGPAPTSSLTPSARAAQDVADPTLCRNGTWSSSTGRCG